MKLHHAFLLGGIILAGAGSLQAQWVPVKGKMREVHQTVVNGKVTQEDTHEGEYYRSSDGSILRHWISVNGDEKRGGQGDFLDNKSGSRYQLQYSSKRAYQMEGRPTGIPPEVARGEAAPQEPLGEDFVAGIRCKVGKIVVVNRIDPRSSSNDAGRSCFSEDYALLLRTEVTVVEQGGSTQHTVFEMHDVRLHEEPDAKLFDLRGQFTVFKPETSVPVAKR